MIDFDFHTHTYPQSSCASQSIGELIDRYSAEGIKVLAICNHDTVDGLTEAREKCEKAGIELVNGVELTCDIKDESSSLNGTIIHILGYGIDNNAGLFNSYADTVKRNNEERVLKICDYLRKKGYAIEDCTDLYDLWPQLVEKNGYPDLLSAKIYLYSDEIESRFPTMRLSHKEGIELIHKLNGLAVWAHPKRVWLHEPLTLPELSGAVDLLKGCSLDGIEVFYPAHFKEKGYVRELLNIAESKNMIVTLGSDCHHLRDDFFPRNRDLNEFDYNFEEIKYFWKLHK